VSSGLARATDRTLTLAATPGQTITAHLHAVGENGPSPDVTATITVPAGADAPKFPRAVTAATPPGPGTATVTWSRWPTDTTPITGWEVSIHSTYGTIVETRAVAPTASSASFTLPPGQYWANVRATTATGVVGFSDRQLITVDQGDLAPFPPQSISVVPGAGKATVSWTQPQLTASMVPPTGYLVTAYPAWPTKAAPVSVTTTGSTMQATLSLGAAPRWSFRVRAWTTGGGYGMGIYSKTYTVGTVAPEIPVVTVNEGNSGSNTAKATVKVLINRIGATSVPWYTELQSGTATPNVDFTTANASTAISASVSSFTVSVKTIGDTVKEADEYFYIVLKPPVGVGFDVERVKVVIHNDD
jgi:hypothetical protein